MTRFFEPPGSDFGSPSGLIFPDPFDYLTADAVRHMLRHEDVDRFLTWMRDEAPQLHPGVFARVPDPMLWPSFATSLGNGLWNAMPLPRNGYLPEPLPPQEPRDPCRCLSGLPFDDCCALFPPPPPFKPEALWTFVAEQLPLEALEDVAVAGHLSGSVLGVVAMRLVDRGAARRAARLLEKVIAEPGRLDASYEVALDALFDAYDALGWNGKKRKALIRLSKELKPPVRGVIWARRATIEADLGNVDKAWEYFSRSQQDDPDNPSLAGLEVSLLLHQGKADQASARARFWLSKLKRVQQGGKAYQHLEELLRGVVDNPLIAVWQFSHEVLVDHLQRYLKVLDDLAERPIPHYDLEPAPPVDPSTPSFGLQPPRALAGLEAAWDEIWDTTFGLPGEEHQPWHPQVALPWIEFLEDHPEALDSVTILDRLCAAARQLEYPLLEEAQKALLLPLVRRGMAIIDEALGDRSAHLSWMHLDNRSALQLVFSLALHLEEIGDWQAAAQVGERLLELNPDDNQGCRGLLMDIYLKGGDDGRALELCDQFDDDVTVEILYGKVLALYRQDRKKEAAEALHEAYEFLPFVWSYLVGKIRRRPEVFADYVVSGGADQAWLYRESMLPVWKSVRGLIPWLRRTVQARL